MTRKRFIKLMMGRHGFSRREVETMLGYSIDMVKSEYRDNKALIKEMEAHRGSFPYISYENAYAVYRFIDIVRGVKTGG